MSFDKDHEVHELIELAIDGTIRPEQAKMLEEWILSDSLACRYYCEYMHLSASIDRQINNVTPSELLANSHCCELDCEDISRFLETDTVFFWRARWFVWSCVSVAAVFMIALLQYFPWPVLNPVAEVNDSIEAAWSSVDGAYIPRKSIAAGDDTLFLQNGYVKLLFNNSTQVFLEAPVRFQIVSDNEIKLLAGKICADVPENAHGFTIYTDNASVIDLGTRFGVHADRFGNTNVYVIEGKARLQVDSGSQSQFVLEAGTAKGVSQTRIISDLKYRDGVFVQKIDSATGMSWRGQDRLSLADIAGGGNGFGSGRSDDGIDPASGAVVAEVLATRLASNDFRKVDNRYVDGVFVPDSNPSQVISSAGDFFWQCPDSSGLTFNSIMYSNRMIGMPRAAADRPGFGIAWVKCLIMHANSGITFDLEEIRKTLPKGNIVSFQTKLGIERGVHRPKASNAGFWVLVDGEVKFSKPRVKDQNLYSVSIDISDSNRFLTLVTTDGGDPAERIIDDVAADAIDGDWGFYVDPVLILN